MIFCSYYAGISMFSHTHISNGTSVVHSHLGGTADHEHSDSQFAIIDLLSNFQSESAVTFHEIPVPYFQLSESYTVYPGLTHPYEVDRVDALRGPPQA